MPSPSRSRGWPRPVGAVVAIAAVAGVLLGTSLPSALAAHPEDRVSAPGRIIPGRIVVRWKSATTPAGRSSARDHARLVGASSLGSKDFQVLTVPAGTQPAAALRALRADPRVAAAEPDRYLATFGTPDDPSLPQQWAIQNTGAPIQGFAGAKVGGDIDVVPAWDRTVGTPQTVVAVIDTGYDFLNPDLGEVAWTNPGEIPGNGIDDDANGKIDDVHGWDFVGANIDTPVEDADPTDDDALGGGHGLHVAGIIGAKGNDGHGITGVAQNVRLMPLRVCTWSQKDNASECSLSAVVSAIN